MSKFHVISTFEIPDRKVFVIIGSVVEGEIRVGMFVNVEFNLAMVMTARIHSIEFARRIGGGDDMCLYLKLEKEAFDLWRSLKIGDETLEITIEGSE